MITWHSRMLVAAGWLVLSACAAAAPPTAAEVRAWLSRLDSEEYSAREDASRQLIEAGEAAIDALGEGVGSASAEAAWRASIALEQIAIRGNEATLNRVTAALEKLSQSGRPGLTKLAGELHAKQARLRHDRALETIRSLGGQFAADSGEVFAFAGAFPDPPAIVEIIDDVVAEKVAADLRLIEVADPAPAKRDLEIPAEIKAFDEALKLAAAGAAKPAEPNVKEPIPPPDAPPADVPPPPPVAALPIGEDPPPPPVAAAIEVAVGDFFMGEAIGFPVGLGGIDSGDEEIVAESLVLDAKWRGGDAGLAALRDLPHVARLSIADAPLTDAALAHIAALPRLADLSLRGKMFSAAALAKFHKQRPQARIFARGDAMLGVNAETDGPCVLSSVYYGSGAYEAGLAQGDEIVKVDGLKVTDFSELTIAVFTRKPGETLKVDFKRDGRLKTVNVILKDRRTVEPGSR